jgi:hypothetical protein
MNRFFFLPGPLVYFLVAVFLFVLLRLEFGHKLLALLFAGVAGFAFRRRAVPFRETLRPEGEIYLSPVHGEVKSIRRQVTGAGHEIRITLGGWDEKGLYLPTSAEVSYMKYTPGLKINRHAASEQFYRPVDEVAHTDLNLMSKNQTSTLIRFIDCNRGMKPVIWLKSGDRGRGAACFGYYPFGGTLLIYLPENSDILVFENERVVPGQTVLAKIKDK